MKLYLKTEAVIVIYFKYFEKIVENVSKVFADFKTGCHSNRWYKNKQFQNIWESFNNVWSFIWKLNSVILIHFKYFEKIVKNLRSFLYKKSLFILALFNSFNSKHFPGSFNLFFVFFCESLLKIEKLSNIPKPSRESSCLPYLKFQNIRKIIDRASLGFQKLFWKHHTFASLKIAKHL